VHPQTQRSPFTTKILSAILTVSIWGFYIYYWSPPDSALGNQHLVFQCGKRASVPSWIFFPVQCCHACHSMPPTHVQERRETGGLVCNAIHFSLAIFACYHAVDRSIIFTRMHSPFGVGQFF
jgi:hypothetical protein